MFQRIIVLSSSESSSSRRMLEYEDWKHCDPSRCGELRPAAQPHISESLYVLGGYTRRHILSFSSCTVSTSIWWFRNQATSLSAGLHTIFAKLWDDPNISQLQICHLLEQKRRVLDFKHLKLVIIDAYVINSNKNNTLCSLCYTYHASLGSGWPR